MLTKPKICNEFVAQEILENESVCSKYEEVDGCAGDAWLRSYEGHFYFEDSPKAVWTGLLNC